MGMTMRLSWDHRAILEGGNRVNGELRVRQEVDLRPDGKINASQARRRLAHDLVEGVQRLTVYLTGRNVSKRSPGHRVQDVGTYFTVSSAIKLVKMSMWGKYRRNKICLHADHREKQAVPVEEVEQLEEHQHGTEGPLRSMDALRGNGTASCQ